VSDPTLSTPAASLRLTRDKDRAFRENFTLHSAMNKIKELISGIERALLDE
jgi:hypothetical protein